MIDPGEQLRGFELSACAVRSATQFYLLAEHVHALDSKSPMAEDGMREAVRIAVYFADREPDRRWAFRTVRHIDSMHGAIADSPLPHLVAVSGDAQVFVLGSGMCAFEQRIPEHRDGPLRGAVRDVISIAGQVHVIQGNRGICRRTGLNGWQSICAGLPVSPQSVERAGMGFRCAAGVRSDSIYAGGDQGDLWYFDGSTWSEQRLPFDRDRGLDSGLDILAMCCVEPGRVHVACRNGTVYLGHGNRWQMLAGTDPGQFGPRISRMVVYQGRVWATSGTALWTLGEDGLQQVALPADIRPGASLAASGSVLLMAGSGGAAYFDGGHWHRIL